MSGVREQQRKRLNEMESRDEVDFVRRDPKDPPHPVFQCPIAAKKRVNGTMYGDCELKTNIKSSLSSLDKFSLFRVSSNKKAESPSPKEKPKFVKSASIARLLGNNYSPKKPEGGVATTGVNSVGTSSALPCKGVNSYSKNCNNCKVNNGNSANTNAKVGSCGARRFGTQERFQKCSTLEDMLSEISVKDMHSVDRDLSVKALRTISRGLGKLWWKRTHSVNISTPDPEFKVSYLGNVLTGWAKGDGCVEKPLSSLWRNYTQNQKPDISMRIRVCASGLKATTRQHGLTEYWAHRVTHCCAPKNYPRIFCWVYRHEGRKLKHEMRCHAVLCSKESIAQTICNTLRENLDRALQDFKREKISKQNARLSLANAVYENPSLPRRKILLSVGGNNYRPPLERSKSAPKLMAIEEAIGEEGEEEETNEPEMPSCCVKGSMYPAMTLGRRRCRRGHSIRRTGKYPSKPPLPDFEATMVTAKKDAQAPSQELQCCRHNHLEEEEEETFANLTEFNKTKSVSSLASEEDEVDKLLSRNNYDTDSPLSEELLSYFDMKLRPRSGSLTNLEDVNILFEPSLISDIQNHRRPALSLDNLDSYSDEGDGEGYDEDEEEDHNGSYYRQSTVLNLLQKESTLKPSMGDNSGVGPFFDSDEGSISSGCETASTVTANIDDSSLKYIQNQYQESQTQQPPTNQIQSQDTQRKTLTTREGSGRRTTTTSDREDQDKELAINFKLPNSNVKHFNGQNHNRKGSGNDGEEISDSEFSDESGYVEFQDNNQLRHKSVVV